MQDWGVVSINCYYEERERVELPWPIDRALTIGWEPGFFGRRIEMSINDAIKRIKVSLSNHLCRLGLSQAHEFTTAARAHSLVGLIKKYKIDTVIDVGANTGQFGAELRAAGFNGHIISFEPQSKEHGILSEVAGKDGNWTVAPRCAVGSKLDTLELNIASNSYSSSLLPMLSQHLKSAPESAYNTTESVPVITLDSCELIPRNQPMLLKSDTQGFELNVLKGSERLLRENVIGLHLEMATAPLYAGQVDFLELYDFVIKSGFSLFNFDPVFFDRTTSQLLTVDGTFIKI
jgi:FkbM family methyltransferase